MYAGRIVVILAGVMMVSLGIAGGLVLLVADATSTPVRAEMPTETPLYRQVAQLRHALAVSSQERDELKDRVQSAEWAVKKNRLMGYSLRCAFHNATFYLGRTKKLSSGKVGSRALQPAFPWNGFPDDWPGTEYECAICDRVECSPMPRPEKP